MSASALTRFGLLALLALRPGLAAAGGTASPFDLKPGREASLLGASALALASPMVLGGLPATPCPCDRSALNPLDRAAAGHYSETASKASDGAAGLMALAPFLLDAADVRHHGGSWKEFGTDATVMLESVMMAEGITQIGKAIVRRPRPFLYGLSTDDPAHRKADNYRSFPSGHTTAAFAAGMSYASTFALRHPERSDRWAVYGAAALGGAAVGTLRVAAGQHFPTDVLAGALVGTAVGLAVPRMH